MVRVLWVLLTALSVALSTVAFAPPPLDAGVLVRDNAPRASARWGGLARLGLPTVRMAAALLARNAAARDVAGNYTHATMQVTGKGALWQDYELDTRLIKVAPRPAARSAVPPRVDRRRKRACLTSRGAVGARGGQGGYHGDEWTTDPLGRSVVNPPVFHASTVTFPTVAALREARRDHPFMGILLPRRATPGVARPAWRAAHSRPPWRGVV